MKGRVFIFSLLILHSACLVFCTSMTHAYSSDEEYSTEFRENLLPAQQGDAKAQVFVGYLYETGQGVQQDNTKAAEWYRRAAERGNAEAQAQLGNMYSLGKGVSQNYVLAYLWLDLAARQGNKQAQVVRERVAAKMSNEQISEARRLAGIWRSKRR